MGLGGSMCAIAGELLSCTTPYSKTPRAKQIMVGLVTSLIITRHLTQHCQLLRLGLKLCFICQPPLRRRSLLLRRKQWRRQAAARLVGVQQRRVQHHTAQLGFAHGVGHCIPSQLPPAR